MVRVAVPGLPREAPEGLRSVSTTVSALSSMLSSMIGIWIGLSALSPAAQVSVPPTV